MAPKRQATVHDARSEHLLPSPQEQPAPLLPSPQKQPAPLTRNRARRNAMGPRNLAAASQNLTFAGSMFDVPQVTFGALQTQKALPSFSGSSATNFTGQLPPGNTTGLVSQPTSSDITPAAFPTSTGIFAHLSATSAAPASVSAAPSMSMSGAPLIIQPIACVVSDMNTQPGAASSPMTTGSLDNQAAVSLPLGKKMSAFLGNLAKAASTIKSQHNISDSDNTLQSNKAPSIPGTTTDTASSYGKVQDDTSADVQKLRDDLEEALAGVKKYKMAARRYKNDRAETLEACNKMQRDTLAAKAWLEEHEKTTNEAMQKLLGDKVSAEVKLEEYGKSANEAVQKLLGDKVSAEVKLEEYGKSANEAVQKLLGDKVSAEVKLEEHEKSANEAMQKLLVDKVAVEAKLKELEETMDEKMRKEREDFSMKMEDADNRISFACSNGNGLYQQVSEAWDELKESRQHIGWLLEQNRLLNERNTSLERQSMNASIEMRDLQGKYETLKVNLVQSTQGRLAAVRELGEMKTSMDEARNFSRQGARLFTFIFSCLLNLLVLFLYALNACIRYSGPYAASSMAYAKTGFSLVVTGVKACPAFIAAGVKKASPHVSHLLQLAGAGSWRLLLTLLSLLEYLETAFRNSLCSVYLGTKSICAKTWRALLPTVQDEGTQFSNTQTISYLWLFSVFVIMNALSIGLGIHRESSNSVSVSFPFAAPPNILPTWTNPLDQAIIDYRLHCPAFGHVYGTSEDCLFAFEPHRVVVGMSHISIDPILEEDKKRSAKLAGMREAEKAVKAPNYITPKNVGIAVLVGVLALRTWL